MRGQVAVVLVLCGCGGSVEHHDASGGGGTDGAAGEAGDGRSGGRTVSASRDPKCPEPIPEAGHACQEEAFCEYAALDRPTYCATAVSCENQGGVPRWVVTEHDSSCGIRAENCPPSFDSAPGVACSDGLMCDYPEGQCECEDCADGSRRWVCRPSRDACSDGALIGDACTTNAGMTCGGCWTQPPMTCSGGYWELSPPIPCPLIICQ